MSYRAFRQDNLSAKTLKTIELINGVLEEAKLARVDMGLRQVYYKFVKSGWIDNDDREYKKLGTALDSGRMNGLIDWDAIVDMERDLYGMNTFDAPEQLLEGLDRKFHRDLWADQEWRPEVWVEKKGMLNVVRSICSELRVDFFACKGYNSQTEAYKAGRRMARYVEKGQRPIVFHLGDHDPSGIDMTRDNRVRLELFAGVPITLVRLALNRDQIDELGPERCPPNPAKLTDSRAESYIAEHGMSSWEVDALDASYIRDLIATNVDRLRNEELWETALAREVADKDWLRTIQRPDRGGDEEEEE